MWAKGAFLTLALSLLAGTACSDDAIEVTFACRVEGAHVVAMFDDSMMTGSGWGDGYEPPKGLPLPIKVVLDSGLLRASVKAGSSRVSFNYTGMNEKPSLIVKEMFPNTFTFSGNSFLHPKSFSLNMGNETLAFTRYGEGLWNALLTDIRYEDLNAVHVTAFDCTLLGNEYRKLLNHLKDNVPN